VAIASSNAFKFDKRRDDSFVARAVYSRLITGPRARVNSSRHTSSLPTERFSAAVSLAFAIAGTILSAKKQKAFPRACGLGRSE